jgi:hypothetical protein
MLCGNPRSRDRNHPRQRISVRLAHPAYVGTTALLAGQYQDVCMEREPGLADVVFIQGKSLNPHKVRAIAASKVTVAEGSTSGDPITLEDQENTTKITQVVVAGKAFHIKADSGPGTHSSENDDF